MMGVRRIGLFGSYALGDQTAASDLDFLVEFADPTLQDYVKLKDFLEALFQRRVDLVFAESVKPRLRPVIFSEAVYAAGL
jgi:predicted nucleotidyltransferase